MLKGEENARPVRDLEERSSGSGVPPLRIQEESRDGSPTLINYFDPDEPVAFLGGTLPHWRQDGTTYFVTFRLADALPQEKLTQWNFEREEWMKAHPEPHDEATRKAYFELFPRRIQDWLDAGSGSCALALPEARALVEDALRFFDGKRYRLINFVVASNHVHVLVAPLAQHTLSEILHSWKSFTAHKLLKLKSVSGRLKSTTFWQKESFDHIVRSPASLEKFRAYIRAHCEYQT